MLPLGNQKPIDQTGNLYKTYTPLTVITFKEQPLDTLDKIAVVTASVAATPSGTHEEWMEAAGIVDTYHADLIFTKESGWQIGVVNSIGCVGLGQACPAGLKPRLLIECPNWQNDPVCQLRVFNDYTIKRYGSYANAWAFHIANDWY